MRRKSRQTQPTVYVIAGPNGAGKTTFAIKFLPKFAKCREFLNADLIAAGLAPFAPQTQNIQAGRLLLQRFVALSSERATFGFETTLSGRTYFKLLRNMKANGYRVELHFLWLPNAETAVLRVAERVRQGGHDVPIVDIRRRYEAGLRNLFKIYVPILDSWWLYDSTRKPPLMIAWNDRERRSIDHPELFRLVKRQVEDSDEG